MTMLDLLGLIVSFVVVGFVLIVSQNLHRAGYSLLFTRKLVHVVIGLWIFPAFFLFDHSWVAIILPILAMIGNAISHFTGLIGSIEMEHDRANFGTILYPASFIVVILVFFPNGGPFSTYWYAGLLGILLMTFADTAASIIGRYLGARQYKIWDETRSTEGSLAMLFVSLFVSWLVFGFLGLYSLTGLSGMGNFLLAMYIAVFATAIEAVSLRGWDNFLVPVGGAFFTLWMLKIFVG
jgi:dolichol kinase